MQILQAASFPARLARAPECDRATLGVWTNIMVVNLHAIYRITCRITENKQYVVSALEQPRVKLGSLCLCVTPSKGSGLRMAAPPVRSSIYAHDNDFRISFKAPFQR